MLKKTSPRQRLFLVASVLYIVVGLIIVGRSVLGHVVPVAILGIVFIALGVVRLRDYARQAGAR